MFGTNKEVKKDAAEKVDYNIKVLSARETKNESIVMVDLWVNGVTIRSCIVKEVTVKKDGDKHKKGDKVMMLAFPSEKSNKDGKYYNRAWFPVSNENMEEIVRQTVDLLS